MEYRNLQETEPQNTDKDGSGGRRMKEAIRITKPEDILPAMAGWKRRRQENFLTVTLDSCHRIIKVHHITKGLVNKTIIHPRECFRPAILDMAASVILVHNHPNGDPTPSSEDDGVTECLCRAGKIIGIRVLDHIIITASGDIHSYRRLGGIGEDFTNAELQRYAGAFAAKGVGNGN